MSEKKAEPLPTDHALKHMFKPHTKVGLDFETYCDLDLTKVGLHNYINHESFQVLGYSIASDGSPNYLKRCSSLVDNNFDPKTELEEILVERPDVLIAAHNAAFEYAVCKRLGLNIPYHRFIDTAVCAAAGGFSRSLAASSAQATSQKKLEVGMSLIRKFSIPNDENHHSCPTRDWILEDHDRTQDWEMFIDEYCRIDAEQSLELANTIPITLKEHLFSQVTHNMNLEGWPVDIALAQEFMKTWERNKLEVLYDFNETVDAGPDFNINSINQLQEFCASRGVRLTSFDEQHVETYLERINNKMRKMRELDPAVENTEKYQNYQDVRMLLETKQIIGGASLRKLDPLLRQTGEDGRLYDQYLHCGAQQTFRTSGRGVQMQNIKRLGLELLDVDDPTLVAGATNATLAANMRQLFAPKERTSELIVGDFSSVESRGLAWLAGANWKLDAYAKGKDLYKVLAAEMFHKDYDNITKEERKIGKVGELSCGYGAGAGAVSTFAAKMGMDMSNNETAQLVSDWRAANPEVVEFWARLDEGINRALTSSGSQYIAVGPSDNQQLYIRISAEESPQSLSVLHPGCQTLNVSVVRKASGAYVFTRVFHGCYKRGRNWCYYKPTSRKTGDLWIGYYTDPNSSRKKFYDIYGGKLAGIITQSFCREIFMSTATSVQYFTNMMSPLRLIGQFHDELVVEADFSEDSFGEVKQSALKQIRQLMSEPRVYTNNLQSFLLEGFPLSAEVSSAHRYIK